MKEINDEKDIQKKLKEEKDKFIKRNIKVEFKEDPQNLKFREYLTKNHSIGGYFSSNNYNLNNFDVFISLKNHIEYLIYTNKDNYNLEIMRIKDKSIITTLKGHNSFTNVVRYYSKDNKEELYIIM